jgi:DNA invertase Pin-like site-specific DNA recombinase
MARLLLHLMAAFSEFERELIRERSMAGLKRYRDQYESGKVGRTVTSRSGKNLPVGRPRRVLDRDRVWQLRSDGLSFRQIAFALGLGEGTSSPADPP